MPSGVERATHLRQFCLGVLQSLWVSERTFVECGMHACLFPGMVTADYPIRKMMSLGLGKEGN